MESLATDIGTLVMFRLTVILIILLLITSGDGWVSHTAVVVCAIPQSISNTQAKPRKRALLVGVSEYCRDGSGAECGRGKKYWDNLNSGNDVDALQQLLTTEQ